MTAPARDFRILLVHPDTSERRLVQGLLERHGHVVHAVRDGAAALRFLEGHDHPHAVVTALSMPGIDGGRLCRLLRASPRTDLAGLPVVVLSAIHDGADAERLVRELGANVCAPPHRPTELARAVDDAVRGRTSVRPLRALLVHPDAAPDLPLAAAFAKHGYAVRPVRDAGEARALGADGPFDVAVVGLGAGGVAPLDLAGEIARADPDAVVVVTTRGPRPDLAAELLRRGVDAGVCEEDPAAGVVEHCERTRRDRARGRAERRLEECTVRLRASESRLRALFRTLPEVLLVHDDAGRILRANPAARAALGHDRLVGRRLGDLGDWPPAGAAVRRVGRVRRYDARFRTAAGGHVELEVTQTPFRHRGRRAHLFVARDVAVRRSTEEQRALLVGALEQATEMILLVDAEGRIRYVNPAFEIITGFSRDEAVGAELALLRGAYEEDADWRRMRTALANGESWRGRMRRHRKDGREYVVEGTFSPVRDPNGRVLHYVGVERDVTQQIELEHAFVQAQKMEAVGTLAGGVAHDFNNLLTGILGYANLIQRLAPAGSEMVEMAAVIETSADRAAELTRQLLGFARRGKNRNAPFDLNDVVRQVARLLRRTISKKIRTEMLLLDRPATVMGDETQIEQVLLNLALNARDAMAHREDGELRFATEIVSIDEAYCAHHPGARPGTYVLASVTDNGTGIPAEHRARIFEPFFTTKPQGEGTGMGLAMVYGAVKNHGGSIRVYSEPGIGTTFKIYLPLRETEVPASRETDEKPVRGSGRILVVDDEEVVRQTAATMLRHLGYEVVPLADGEEAVLYYHHFGQRVDLVLLDMVMPKMGGRECFAKLKEMDPDVRAVLATGFGLNEAAQKILDDGVLGFVPKPYRAAELSAVVAKAIRGETVPARSRP